MRETIRNFLRFLLTTKYQLSLAVLIPLFLALFTFGPLSIAVNTIEKLIAGRQAAGALSDEALREALRSLRLVLWVSVAAAVGSGLVLSYSILAPLKRFLRDTRAAFTGAREAALPDELGILGRDFSLMMSSLSSTVSILQSMSGGVIVFDRDGRLTAVNPSAELLLSRRSGELVGKSLADVCGPMVMSPELERMILDGLRRDRPYSSAEVRLRIPGNRDIVVGITTSLLKDAGGKTAGVVANFLDLTGIRRMHEDLQQKLRMAGLGRVAAGVAHEVRNPLGAIKGLAQLIQEGLAETDPRRKYGAVIERETDRLNSVVEDLLGLVHGPAERTACALNAVLAEARELALPALAGKQVELLDETGPVPEITAERERLVQAFLNVFRNAFEAVPDQGRVRCRTTELPDRSAVSIEIANTGPAIPSEVQERMFEPFFTTKQKGSGLGLSIAHQVITAHGGDIKAERREDETVITMTLTVDVRREA